LKRKLLTIATVAATVIGLAAVAGATALAGGPQRSDFALKDVTDASVECGASHSTFTIHITMTNRSDLGGGPGFVRVTYHDGDFVDYAIPVDTSLQISLAGGGTPGVDDLIKVTDGGAARLIGQESILLQKSGKPLPETAPSYCITDPPGVRALNHGTSSNQSDDSDQPSSHGRGKHTR
jgi:hypothetical protein